MPLELDLTRRSLNDVGRASRPVSVTLYPVLKSPRQNPPRAGWLLRAVVKSRVTLDKLFLDFGDEPTENAPPLARKVRGRVHVLGAFPRVRATDGVVSLKLERGNDWPSDFRTARHDEPGPEDRPFQNDGQGRCRHS